MNGITSEVVSLVVEDARADLAGLGTSVDVWSLSDVEVIDLADAVYPGGWHGFLRESAV